MEHNSDPQKNREIGILVFFVFLGASAVLFQLQNNPHLYQQQNEEHFKVGSGMSGTIGAADMPLQHSISIQEMEKGSMMVKPQVGNRGDPDKAWNDTPTIGMLMGNVNNPENLHQRQVRQPDQSDLVPKTARVCHVPTGYLGAIVKAWEKGKRTGLVESQNIIVDMGQEGGGFYDTNGDGCCDEYCRRVVKGGWWSCINPQTVTTQYKSGLPRGRKCDHYGKMS